MRSVVLAIVVTFAATGCGKDIGDSCVVSSDCSPNGDRLCIDQTNDGYCTVAGCDFSTCPDGAACIRFFTGSFENRDCQSNNDCTLDELCSLSNKCVPRSSEIRYCMATCDSDGDCRDGYECRDLATMRLHGGEPVLEPGTPIDDSAPKFCAVAPP
jgi:hypothetical protein